MRKANDTLFRYLALLQMLPQYPNSLSTSEIKTRLSADNVAYEVDVRTIQRDLIKLSTVYSIEWDTEGKTNRWYWREKSTFTQIPAMSAPSALALRLANEYLSAIMPPAVLKSLHPYFEHAQGVLKDTKLDQWSNKVKILRLGPELIPPAIDHDVHDVVYQALLEGRQIKVRYQGRGKAEPSEYNLSPQGLVARDGIVYLVASLWDYDEACHFPLQRMQQAELLEEPARKLEDFSLARHIKEDKEFSYPVSDRKIRLKVLVDEAIAAHLAECRLSEDQTLKPQEDGRMLLQATVADTEDLRWWLLGFGDHVEVMAPKAIRREFTELFTNLQEMYGESE